MKPELKNAGAIFFLGGCLILALPSQASEWDIQPSLKLSSIYSDNIGLDNDPESDLVLEVAPGVRATRDTRRLSLNFDYQLQNLTYLEDSRRNTTNHRFFADMTAEALRDTLFVDVSSTISQQLIDRERGASSNAVSGGGNLSDVYSYSVSPYWQGGLGGFAEWLLRYTYDEVHTESSGSDSDRNAVAFDLSNGPATDRLSWTLSYDNQQVDYDDGDRSDTELASARVNYRFYRSLSAVVSGTYEDNEFIGSRGNARPDDSYVGAGLNWRPSDDFDLTVQYNERLDPNPDEDADFISADLFWSPTPRTDVNLSYGNRFFGDTYSGSLAHRTRWTRWNFSYDEGTSNFRTVFLESGRIACPAGATVIGQCRIVEAGETLQPGETFLGNLIGVNTSIGEDTFISRRGRATVSVVGVRNTITLGLTHVRRTFVADDQDEKDVLWDVSWTYEMAPYTDSRVTLARHDLEFDDGEADDIMRYAWRVTREVGASSIFYVEAQYYDRDSDVDSRIYDESRLTVSFEKFF